MTEAERDLLIAIGELLAPRLNPEKPLRDEFAHKLWRVKIEALLPDRG